MEQSEKIKFKKKWDNYIEKKFWYEFKKRETHLFLHYPFNFGWLKSDVRWDLYGNLHLCYIYEERHVDILENQLLKNLFHSILNENSNEKYIGFYKCSKSENFRDVLRAILILGNEIEDSDLKNFMLYGKTNCIYKGFLKTKKTSDELFENYLDEIILELEIIALKVKNAIFENKKLAENINKMMQIIPVI